MIQVNGYAAKQAKAPLARTLLKEGSLAITMY
jgi:hypothetical protein